MDCQDWTKKRRYARIQIRPDFTHESVVEAVKENLKELWPGWETVRLVDRSSRREVFEIRRELFGKTEYAAVHVFSASENGDARVCRRAAGEYMLLRELNGSGHTVYAEEIRCEPLEPPFGWNAVIKTEPVTPLKDAVPETVDERTVIRIGKELCRALEHCRKLGIVHRAVQPGNIFVSANGVCKLGGFGAAKAAAPWIPDLKELGLGTPFRRSASEREHTGEAFIYTLSFPDWAEGDLPVMAVREQGNVAELCGRSEASDWNGGLWSEAEEPDMDPISDFSAPEALYGGDGHSSDLYSLGMVLCWLANGKQLPKAAAILSATLNATDNCSPGLARILCKATAYDLKSRYYSPEDMLADLEALGSAEYLRKEHGNREAAAAALEEKPGTVPEPPVRDRERQTNREEESWRRSEARHRELLRSQSGRAEEAQQIKIPQFKEEESWRRSEALHRAWLKSVEKR